VVGLAARVWPVWLAAVDHVIWPAPKTRSADSGRALMACVLSAVVACGAYAVVVPLRISQAIGVELPPRMLAVALASSLVLHLFLFAAIFLAVMTVMGASRLIRDEASSEYWLVVLLLAACTTLVLYVLVCASIAFTGRDGWAACAALAVASAAVWANVARLRSHQVRVVHRRSEAGSRQSIDSLELFSAPVAGVRSRAPAITVLVVIPLFAYMLVDAVRQFDSDHGDSLGEEGRWGHAYFIYPEVMNIPLIVHLPSWLKARVRTDLDAVVFSTDITPSLYVLLGYQPEDLGPLFGQSFFTPRDGDSSRRRREMFLLASSYGAVYGAVGQNGRRMYAVDAVGGVEYAVDVSRPSGSLAVTRR